MRPHYFHNDVEPLQNPQEAPCSAQVEAFLLMLAEREILDCDTRLAHKMPLDSLAKPRRRQHLPSQHHRNRSRHLALAISGGTKCNPG